MSGSYNPGDIYVFRGLGRGQYARGEKLRFKGGLPVRAGQASSVALADWDRDGRIDLIVGNIYGQVSFLPNQSKDHQLFFGPGDEVRAGGRTIVVDRDAAPLVADWNGDGIPDLLVGAYDGSVTLFTGSGRAGVPVLSEGKTLVARLTEDQREPILRERDPKTGAWLPPALERPSIRSKLAVFDWNGDGKLDLLVGDAVSTTGPEPTLDDAEKKERDDLEKQSKALNDQVSRLYSELRDRIWKELRQQNPETDETTLGGMVFDRAHEALSKDQHYRDLTTGLADVRKKLSPLRADRSTHGFVWVYLRTSDAR